MIFLAAKHLGVIHKVRTQLTWAVHYRGHLPAPVRIKSARAPTGSIDSKYKEPGD